MFAKVSSEVERVPCGAETMSFSSVTLPGGVGGAPQFGGGTGDAFNDSSCESPTPFQNGTRQVGPNSPVCYSESPYDTLKGPFLPWPA